MDFDIFTEIVFVEKMETLTCFSNERICKALSLKEILVIVPLIKTMLSSSFFRAAIRLPKSLLRICNCSNMVAYFCCLALMVALLFNT